VRSERSTNESAGSPDEENFLKFHGPPWHVWAFADSVGAQFAFSDAERLKE